MKSVFLWNMLLLFFQGFLNSKCTDQFFKARGFKQIHSMQMLQTLGHITNFKADRDDEDLIVKQFRFLQGDLQFLMAIALLFIEFPRKTDDHEITLENRFADFMLPILPGLKIF